MITNKRKLEIVLSHLHEVVDTPWIWGEDVLGFAIEVLLKVDELPHDKYDNCSITQLYEDSLVKG
jgi:hypothetical protein